MSESNEPDVISEIISEFTEAFAFSRTRWTRFANEVSAELSGVNMLVLQIVLRKGPITATGIGQMLDMDKSLVSRHIAKLRELGLVDGAPAEEDRRVHLLTASAEANELLGGVRARWANSYRERFAGWGDSELATLRDGLHRFNAAAEPQSQDSPAVRCSRQAGEDPSGGGASTEAQTTA